MLNSVVWCQYKHFVSPVYTIRNCLLLCNHIDEVQTYHVLSFDCIPKFVLKNMDWKYISALNTDNLNDTEKDELYNTVTWYDYESEEIKKENLRALLKVCQEILKYKGEQVETLFHELEEMAIKQAEEDARKQDSDAELRSARSRKSSSLEFENLEQKYVELKAKYKQTLRNNEKINLDLKKVSNKMKSLEQENRRLEKELQSIPHDAGSESDISETIKDHQKELVDTLQNKNKQISELLRDIENVESENLLMRDKLSKVRDELEVATKEIIFMTQTLKLKEESLKESTEHSNKMVEQYDNVKKVLEKLQHEKNDLENEMKKQLTDLNQIVGDLKETIEQKDGEIQGLKARLKEPSFNSSISSLPKDEPEQCHMSALQRVLDEREKQLLEVQTQLQIATKDIKEMTDIMKKFKNEKDSDSRTMERLEQNMVEIKKQLSTAHERCQKMQDEVDFAEKISRSKDEELNKILSKLQENGQVDLVVNLREIQELKADNRMKEKQIMGLVKTSNKIQENCDCFEKENDILREKLGIPIEEELSLGEYTSKQKKMIKELGMLRNQLSKKDDKAIHYKLEVRKLNHAISSLTRQIIDLGQEPQYNNFENVNDDRFKNENKTLAEENEALRKGMHEILHSINMKKTASLKEVKSETFEKLLRALDVKHVSGWYHPAMRLQAEIHNLEGINSELRDQLREARLEIAKLRTSDYKYVDRKQQATETGQDSEDSVKKLEDSSLPEKIAAETLDILLKKLLERINTDKSKEENITVLEQQLLLWFRSMFVEKNKLEETFKSVQDKLKNLQEEYDNLMEKLKILICETEEEKVKKIDDLVLTNSSMKRKVCYLENETRKLSKKIEEFYKDIENAEHLHSKKIGELQRKNKSLENNLKIAKNLNDQSVDLETYKEVDKNLANMTVKYREVVDSLKKQAEDKSLETLILLESQKNFESDKKELENKLVEVMSKLSLQNLQNVEYKVEKLSQKLAETEVNEISERQRANHTNNLYDLVKEQLNKSEERFQEYSKFNDDLLKRNLALQDQLRDAENKISDYIDPSLYNKLQESNSELLKENERLEMMITKMTENSKLEKQTLDFQMTWNESREQELLNLKHQVVDLVSMSDEKVIIAQLNSDILQYRQSQNYNKIKMKEVTDELENLNYKYSKDLSKLENEKSNLEENEAACKKKIRYLQQLFDMQKLQYIGCIPLCSEEIYVNNIITMNKDKHEAFLSLHKAKMSENEANLLKDQLTLELTHLKTLKEMSVGSNIEGYKNVLSWMQEKKVFQINELRYKRQSEFKEAQLQHFIDRVKLQDEQLAKLDEELLLWHKHFNGTYIQKNSIVNQTKSDETPIPIAIPIPAPRKFFVSVEVQTIEDECDITVQSNNDEIISLKSEISRMKDELLAKEQFIGQLRSKVAEHEMTISLFRKQIGDKQSQISFYEHHIMELQSKKGEISSSGAGGDNISVGVETTNSNEEVVALKGSVKDLQDNLKNKDEEIMKYQTLLKVDRDKHSMAAATLQEELQSLQKLLSEEKRKCQSLEEQKTQSSPPNDVVEQYMSQVNDFEKHASELHTKVTSLDAQLHSSREEAMRWRNLANDRLTAMEDLRQKLDNRHRNELDMFKMDIEKMIEIGKDEANYLRQLMSKQRVERSGRLDADIQKFIKDKDDRINELTTKLRYLKNNMKRSEQPEKEFSPKLSDLESSREALAKENELLKRRYEQLVIKERNAKEEIRELKAQLLKKPITARSDKSERSIKDQLQRKILNQEEELISLKKTLEEQIAINDIHKVQASDDFDKWKKMKHWQQAAEKYKNKLKEKEAEFEKSHQSNTGYRLLIERIEREKHNLENRIKSLKTANRDIPNCRELEMLKIENMRLSTEIETLNSRLEMQQHHSGGLGAAMMQEKLESQERKIAIFEVAAKGTVEIRAELERLQTAISNIQKTNLRLEAENLDLKIDLEQKAKEVPQLQQQIRHLENYTDVLKVEKSKEVCKTPQPQDVESKRVSELERTVFILKRVVEKLQAENKRLCNGKRPISDRAASADKLKRENNRLKEEYTECAQKLDQLEKELLEAKNKLKNTSMFRNSDGERLAALSEELSKANSQLEHKSTLLDKVKILLHRAAAKERLLLQEIAELRNQRTGGINPILEESEGSSSDV
ncbi:unnamed protein product [Phaedon cochleariae]|uniref:Centrosomal protein of 290 kDa n=1 Tax=Phaedon cochleariae TaxID=80249 RepID=A0A9P0DN13_PHACE|nr:unnamed protein product [Phaedon cochleariae]